MVAILFGIFYCVTLGLLMFFIVRTNKVRDLRIRIIDLEAAMLRRKMNRWESPTREELNFPIYSSLPTFESMIFSFKKIELENYLTAEQMIDLLTEE